MILVASHTNYQAAWEPLKVSMMGAGVPMTEVVRVMAGAAQESYMPPTDTEAHTITTPYNFYEMTAVYGLYRFLHIIPALQSPKGYILIHDTCYVGTQFYDCARRFLDEMNAGQWSVYHAWKDMRLNIVGLSMSFIQDHGAIYGINGDKPMAWDAEHGGEYAFRRQVPAERVAATTDEIYYGTGKNFYGSGIIRHGVYCPSLDLYKLVANNDADVNPSWELRNYP